ncbi:hypothetical protein LJR164_004473 [Phenylobacterium sp. LjRoot164]|uniref:hypothetical protein n=1 Tax=unclassified Phenylobacterium TaxID=2640670 RepID=UPI003ECCC43D
MKTVYVIPAAEGWIVRSDAIGNELYFKTGAAAERAGRRLAEGLARAGHAAKLSIVLRDGSPAANFLCPPLEVPAPPPSLGGVEDRAAQPA